MTTEELWRAIEDKYKAEGAVINLSHDDGEWAAFLASWYFGGDVDREFGYETGPTINDAVAKLYRIVVSDEDVL